MMNEYSYIEKNLLTIRCELASLAASVGRAAPTLVCVTKSGSDDELLALASLGVSDIGENRPQELCRRQKLLADHGFFPAMHEIGSLQKNKVRQIVPFVSLIESVDSPELAAEIDKRAEAAGRVIPVLIEVNSGSEPQKGGVLPGDVLAFADGISPLRHIALSGLMTMGPAGIPASEMRRCFSLTRELLFSLQTRFDLPKHPILSMGMSESYAEAVLEGATQVRIGRKLFYKEEKSYV